MTEIFMPKAGMDMKEGRLIRWLKEVGDPVEKDEPVMEIETDKITMEAEAPGSGILLAKTVEEDTWVPVLSVIGYIGEPGEKIPEAPAASPKAPEPSQLEDAPLPSAAPAGLEALRRAAGEEYHAAMGASRGALRAFLAAVLAARAGEAPEEAAALAPRIAALFGS